MKKHRVFSLFTVIFVAFLLCRAVTIVPTGYTGVKTSFKYFNSLGLGLAQDNVSTELAGHLNYKI